MMNIKLASIIIIATIASIGTIPYGFRFAITLGFHSHWLIWMVGSFLGIASALGNIALGSYSLLSMQIAQKSKNPILLFIASLLSAIPMGFVCYVGYNSLLPFSLNLLTAFAVTLINAAIGYTAISNLMIEIKHLSTNAFSTGELFFKLIGLLIGVASA